MLFQLGTVAGRFICLRLTGCLLCLLQCVWQTGSLQHYAMQFCELESSKFQGDLYAYLLFFAVQVSRRLLCLSCSFAYNTDSYSCSDVLYERFCKRCPALLGAWLQDTRIYHVLSRWRSTLLSIAWSKCCKVLLMSAMKASL